MREFLVGGQTKEEIQQLLDWARDERYFLPEKNILFLRTEFLPKKDQDPPIKDKIWAYLDAERVSANMQDVRTFLHGLKIGRLNFAEHMIKIMIEEKKGNGRKS